MDIITQLDVPQETARMLRMHALSVAPACAQDLAKQADVMSWLMFQMVCFTSQHFNPCVGVAPSLAPMPMLLVRMQGGLGPMQGQANHFVR